MNGQALRQGMLWVALLCGVTALSGCLSDDRAYDSLQLDRISPHSTRDYYVNITEGDLVHYPPVEELLLRWEQENRNDTYRSFSVRYPYEDGLALIAALQSRVPEGYWRTESVTIAYKDILFDLSAVKTVS